MAPREGRAAAAALLGGASVAVGGAVGLAAGGAAGVSMRWRCPTGLALPGLRFTLSARASRWPSI
eukprot:scaffold44225_cov60-Phaeocystis_antarctica.AAC.1